MHAQLSPGKGVTEEGAHAGATTAASMRQAARATIVRMRKLAFSTKARVAGGKNTRTASKSSSGNKELLFISLGNNKLEKNV